MNLLKSSKLILGTVQLGLDYGINNVHGKPSKQEAFDILSTAEQSGVFCLDTAAAYGNSEEIIGAYHREAASRPFKIITKFHVSDEAPQRVVEEALSRLSVNRIETLLFHSFADYKAVRETVVYEQLYTEVGKSIKHLGASAYTNDELRVLSEDSTIEVVQLPFNLLDNEASRGETLRMLQNQGKTVHTRSVFLQGLFFKDIRNLPIILKPLEPYLDRIHEMANESEIPVGALALQYVLSKNYINGVLFGVESVHQLRTNLDWLSVDIDTEFFDQIDQIKVEENDLLNPTNW